MKLKNFEIEVQQKQQADIAAYNEAQLKGVKSASAELMKYIRHALIAVAEHTAYDLGKKSKIETNPQTAGRLTNTLGLLASGGTYPPLLDAVSISIRDKETAVIEYKINQDALSNGYRKVLNQTYGWNLPEIEEPDNTDSSGFAFEFESNT